MARYRRSLTYVFKSNAMFGGGNELDASWRLRHNAGMREPSPTPSASFATPYPWPWFRDQVWGDQGWVDNATPGAGPGAAPASDAHYVPEARTHTATRFWAAGFGVLALLAWAGVVWGEDIWAQIGAGVSALVLSAMALLALHTAVANQWRRVDWDESGLCDASYFGVRRVPWAAITEVKRVNSALARQGSYDRAGGGVARATSATLRPRDIWVWQALAAQGQTLLDFTEPDRDEVHPTFHALVRRLEQHVHTLAPTKTRSAKAAQG